MNWWKLLALLLAASVGLLTRAAMNATESIARTFASGLRDYTWSRPRAERSSRAVRPRVRTGVTPCRIPRSIRLPNGRRSSRECGAICNR